MSVLRWCAGPVMAATLVVVMWLVSTTRSGAGIAGGLLTPWAYVPLVAASVVAGIGHVRVRRALLLLLSVAPYPIFLGLGAVAVIVYAVALCGIARLRLKVRYQIGLAAVLWASLPLGRAYLFPLEWQLATFLLAAVWAGLLYSSLWLVVERRRWPGTTTLLDELLYLLALPRLVAILFAPISLRHFLASERGRPDPRAMARGFLLGLYGVGLAVVLRRLSMIPAAEYGFAAQVAIDSVLFYCLAANYMFVSIALFRLMGFDIASPFRLPYLSRTFDEFFRRFNRYVRDAVLSLFYFPLLGWLRRRVPRRVATIAAAYLSILIGSFLLNDMLVPAVTSVDPVDGIMGQTSVRRTLLLVLYWSAIILPGGARWSAGGEQTGKASLVWRALEVLRFNLLFVALGLAALWVSELLG